MVLVGEQLVSPAIIILAFLFFTLLASSALTFKLINLTKLILIKFFLFESKTRQFDDIISFEHFLETLHLHELIAHLLGEELRILLLLVGILGIFGNIKVFLLVHRLVNQPID